MIGWLLRILTGRTVLKKPEQLAPCIIEHFEAGTEQEIAQAELQVMGAYPHSAERGLLYALRVSKCVPTLKSLEALGSRWRVANEGSRGTGGLSGSMRSRNYKLTHDFLARLYVRRFWELVREVATRAEQAATSRKTSTAKRNALMAAIRKIEDSQDKFVDLPGGSEQANGWIAYLEQKVSEFSGLPAQPGHEGRITASTRSLKDDNKATSPPRSGFYPQRQTEASAQSSKHPCLPLSAETEARRPSVPHEKKATARIKRRLGGAKSAGYIGYFKLADWWLTTFSKEERDYIETTFKPLGGSVWLTKGNLLDTSQTAAGLLSSLAGWFQRPGDRHIARCLLAKAEEVALRGSDVLDLHFVYNTMIKTYYSDRNSDPRALDLAISACEKQIELAPKAAAAFRREERSFSREDSGQLLPTHSGYLQLAIIREKQGDYPEAIRLAKQAKRQKWAENWDKRIARLETKFLRAQEKRKKGQVK